MAVTGAWETKALADGEMGMELGRGPCEGRWTAPDSLESEADDAGVITVL